MTPTAIPALCHFPKEKEYTGTTLVACETKDGVVVATDSRTSSGNYIGSRATDKITVLNDHIVLLRAGASADSQAIADITMYYAEAHSVMDEEPITVYNVAQYSRKIHYNYRDQLECVVIIAGYDEFKLGQVYQVSSGGYTTRQPVYISGSGGSIIHGYMNMNWKPGMETDEALKLMTNAVFLAQYHDGASGGVINLAFIGKDGMKKTIVRPDKPGYPKLDKIPTYPNLPEHIPQPGFAQQLEEQLPEGKIDDEDE